MSLFKSSMSLGNLLHSADVHGVGACWMPGPVLEVERQAKIPTGTMEHVQEQTAELITLVGGKC